MTTVDLLESAVFSTLHYGGQKAKDSETLMHEVGSTCSVFQRQDASLRLICLANGNKSTNGMIFLYGQ